MRGDVKVTVEQLSPMGFASLQELVKRSQEAARRALLAAAETCRTEVIKAIHATKPYAPIDQGWLNDPNRGWEVGEKADRAFLESRAPHAAFIEFGTKPHWAPLAPLKAWAERKLRAKFRPKDRAAAADRLAYAVQRKIAERGTEGRFFFRRASERFPEIVSLALEDEMNRLATRGN